MNTSPEMMMKFEDWKKFTEHMISLGDKPLEWERSPRYAKWRELYEELLAEGWEYTMMEYLGL